MAGLKVVTVNEHHEIHVDDVDVTKKQVVVRKKEDNSLVGYVTITQNLFMIKSDGVYQFEGIATPSLRALVKFGNTHLSLDFFIE